MTLRHRVHRVIYVPLDDRPVNTTRPRLLAQMVDFEMIMPPDNLLGRYKTPGRPDEIAEWLRSRVAEPHAADCLILSLDMLVYGGLVASREADVSADEARQRLEIVAALRKAAPGIPIYASSVIVRTAGAAGAAEPLEHQALLQEYCCLAGQAALTNEDSQRLEWLRTQIPITVLKRYQQVRQRNHQVNLYAIEYVAGGNIDFLVLPQDDAAPAGLHVGEQTHLHKRIDELEVADRVMIYPGADEVGMTLFARFVHQHMEKQLAVQIEYTEPEGSHRIAPFEDRSIAEAITAQVAVVGGHITDHTEDADLVLLVNTPSEDDADEASASTTRKQLVEAAINKIRPIAARRGIAVCDVATANGADECLMSVLLASGLEVPELLAFAGWNTASNSVGSALAHSTLRLIARQDKGAFDLAHLFTRFAPMRYLQLLNSLINTEKAHIQLLFMSLVDDWLYQTHLRPQIKQELEKLVGHADFDLSECYPRAEQMLRDSLAEAAADLWMNHFWGKRCVQVGTDENRNDIVLAELEETRVRLPWRRLFEVELEFDINMELVAQR